MRKTIFLIINSLNGGGAERVASRLSKVWNEKYDLKVVSLAPFTKDDYEFYGELISINEYCVEGNWIKRIKSAAKRIDELAATYHPSVMISFLQNANLCLMFTKNTSKKIISIRNYLDYQYNGIKRYIWKYLVKHYFKRADYVVSVSELINDEMINKYRISREKCVCIYNPYNTDEIVELANEEIEDCYKDFFSKTVICNMGHVSKQKGQYHLIRILPKLIERNPDVRISIIGDDNSDYANKLRELARELGVEKYVLFLGLQKNPYKYLKNSFCFVFPSLYEGFPNALVEAMVIGLPVIANDCKSGPREILRPSVDNEYGFLLNDEQMPFLSGVDELTNNENKMIEIIERICKDDDLYSYYKNLSILRASDFSIDKIIKEWDKVINA